MKILLVGKGKMAAWVSAACTEQGIVCIRFDERVDTAAKLRSCVAIHLGSGRQLPELIELCARRKIPIIQGSTNVTLATARDVLIVNAPNFSIPMIRFMSIFPTLAIPLKMSMKVRVKESHQSEKAGTSGTARVIARDIGVQKIESIRDAASQLAFGVPEEHLDAHAYQSIIFEGHGVEINVTTKIHGREAYAKDVLTIARALIRWRRVLSYKVYEAREILHMIPSR